MKNILVYVLIGALLYYIYTRIFLKSNLAKENFDPSLVPVSSIVTLAKVAQKLVNGNGTLTNPGNLQIGASTSAAGNLTVTGNERINGNSLIDGTLGVTGNTTVGGTLGVTGASTLTGNTQIGGTLGVTGDTTIGGALITGTASGTNYIKGTTNMNTVNTNSIGVTGNTTVGGNVNISAGSGNNGINITSGNPYVSFAKTGSSGVPQLYSDGTTLHAYNAPFQVDKDLTVSGTTTLNSTIKLAKNTWHTDTDGHQRLYFSSGASGIPNGGTSYYESPNNIHEFRGGGAGAEKLEQMVLNDGNLKVSGNINANGAVKAAGGPSIPVPKASGAGQTLTGSLSTGTLNMGPFFNGGSDMIHSSKSGPLLLNSDSGTVTVSQNNLDVGGNLKITGNSLRFGNFMLTDEGGGPNGYICLRRSSDTPGSGGSRICFNPATGIIDINGTGVNQDTLNFLTGLKSGSSYFGLQSKQTACVDAGNARYANCVGNNEQNFHMVWQAN